MDNRTVLYVLTAMDAASVVTALTTVQFKQKKNMHCSTLDILL